jgi:carbamoyltransferase
MIILGLNPGYDATAALVIDGQIAAVVEEERLSRVKMHLGFPRRAIQEAIRLAGIDPADIGCVAFSFMDYLDAHPVITRLLLEDRGCPFDPDNRLRPGPVLRSLVGATTLAELVPPKLGKTSRANRAGNERTYLRELRALGINVPAIVPVEHHLSHAASAYYLSGFDECLVVTADGCGDGLSATVSVGSHGRLRRIREVPADASAGLLYSAVTAFLGFRAHRHEGKITGLAAFGDPAPCYDELIPCLRVSDDGRTFTRNLPGNGTARLAAQMKGLVSGQFFRNPWMNCYLQHFNARLKGHSREDIAAAVQRRLEDLFVEYLQPIVRETGLDKLALAGGVFANVRLNQRLSELDGVREVVIHPNMGDGGNALGSALAVDANGAGATNDRCPGHRRLADVYLGPGFTDEEIEAELRRRGVRYYRSDDVESVVADKVATGEVVGRFEGRMEYGPRALGHRSILANPADPNINAVLNERLHRTEFMPFAPSVLEEDAGRYFELPDGNRYAAEFMTITTAVRPEQRAAIPAVTHVDGTARPHIVRQAVNPSFHRILREFKRRTGLGVVVNTSFNIHEEPIICTPADACVAFQQGATDALAIGSFIVER